MTDTPPKVNPRLPMRVLNAILAVIAAIWFWLEEWLWDHLLVVTAWLAKLPPIRWLEAKIARLPPYAALAAFLIPAAVLLPFKLFAFWLIAQGHGWLGMQVFIIAKLVGTALLARIFALTRPALLSVGWFARAYHAIIDWKSRLYTYVKNLPAYQGIVEYKNQLRAKWQLIRRR